MKISTALLIPGLTMSILGQVQAQETPNIEFGGRVQADKTEFDNDKFQHQDGTEIRRARLFVRGDLSENWDYKLQYDFAPDHTEVKDAYVRYSGFENTRISIGNFKQFASLEELTSSNNMTFTERGLPNALVTGRRVGVGYQHWSDRYSVFLSAYDNEPNNVVRGKGVAGRFAYRPLIGEGTMLHLGVNLAREEKEDDIHRLRARNETHQDSHRIVNTGHIANVESYTKVGLEAAYVNGQFSAQSEIIRQDLQRGMGSDLSFGGYYAYVSYFLTDDTRPYSNTDAIFGTVAPSSSSGAWEVAARFSNLDLTDKDITGGEVDSITLGVNYYMTRDLRFSANYIMADSDDVAGDDDPNALQLRIRFTF
jgi:phosphate-selective porin OprO/OprP